ncbi:MAG: hypothetical protein HY801_02985 [Candidatus Lindowbacteria bacterium]|nr:hypothetical protein [Candidatus Lindowbacteria bacterium]
MPKGLALGATAVFLGFVLAGCTTTEQGAIARGAIGAGTGAIIGHQTGHGGEGALIGGAIGAVSGGRLDISEAGSRSRTLRMTLLRLCVRKVFQRTASFLFLGATLHD